MARHHVAPPSPHQLSRYVTACVRCNAVTSAYKLIDEVSVRVFGSIGPSSTVCLAPLVPQASSGEQGVNALVYSALYNACTKYAGATDSYLNVFAPTAHATSVMLQSSLTLKYATPGSSCCMEMSCALSSPRHPFAAILCSDKRLRCLPPPALIWKCCLSGTGCWHTQRLS